MATTPNYEIDYTDEKFGKVESDKNQALTELEQTYGGMIESSDKYFDAQIQASKEWADKQSQIQQEQTDFAIEQIEQQKQQANKDYQKEQSGAYVDWRKQSNQYGTEAEKMASAGLANTGFSESSQVSMYNTYQNRVATAREVFSQAVLNYNNAIKDAQLQNNAALAEIAFQALQQQLELSLEGFQYKNQLILEQANKKTELDNMYYNRYQDVLQQINTENAIKEDIRQYNETQKWNTEQAQLNRDHDVAMAELENKYQTARDEANRKFQEAQAELDREHEESMLAAKSEAERQQARYEHMLELTRLERAQANELARINKELEAEMALLEYQNSLKTSYGSVSDLYGKGVSVSSSVKPTWANTNSRGVIQPGRSDGTVNTTAKFTGSTYKDAAAYLKSKGVSSAGLLTASEWSRRRSSYSMTGIGNAAVKNYSSYESYLRDYVNYTVSNK
jgi:hypothetical protein